MTLNRTIDVRIALFAYIILMAIALALFAQRAHIASGTVSVSFTEQWQSDTTAWKGGWR